MTKLKLAALDIETISTHPTDPLCSLKPWEAPSNAVISCISWVGNDGRSGSHREAKLFDPKNLLNYDLVFAHNMIFDLSFLMASFPHHSAVMSKILWADTMLLWAWFDTARLYQDESFSLKAAAEQFLGVDFNLTSSVTVKNWMALKELEKQQGFKTENTLQYNQLDAIACLRVAEVLIPKLNKEQRNGFLIEQKCLVPVAKANVHGIAIDTSKMTEIQRALKTELATCEADIGIDPVILRSPKQLSNLLYNEWGWGVKIRSEITQMPSTDKAALVYGALDDPRGKKLLKWRELTTLLNKFQTDMPIIHPIPRIFGTYTGRMTYSATIMRQNVGLPIHQIPRRKDIREMITVPEGYKLVEFDAAGQEMRLMACLSGDTVLQNLFSEGKDVHSYTGSILAGISYEEFMAAYEQKDPVYHGPQGYRYAGKFINLASQYRIGVKKMITQAKVAYDLDITEQKAYKFRRAYQTAYPKIPQYWERAVIKAKQQGYAQSLGGRRIHIKNWGANDDKVKWAAESTAINFPIQASGADMKELAIITLQKKFPLLIFYFDLHDGLWYLLPENITEDYVLKARQELNNLSYKTMWGWTPPIPLIWSASIGKSMGDRKEL